MHGQMHRQSYVSVGFLMIHSSAIAVYHPIGACQANTDRPQDVRINRMIIFGPQCAYSDWIKHSKQWGTYGQTKK